ncbi:MAG: bifunctional pyr operon transcriptional regulator/uracil phosphoribosyltransferase PyrR [Candidatus Omnitrophota bacterium]
MTLKEKANLMSDNELAKAITRIAHEVLEKNKDRDLVAIVGIKYRGMFLAERIAAEMKRIAKRDFPVGAMDITLYRDDLTQVAEQPVVHATEIEFDVSGRIVVLVDDVLFTGRTVRCALDELIDFGRPKMIQLAVLIDRGHREFPIRPDYVGKSVPTSLTEVVEVRMKESDGKDEVVLCQK